MFIASVMAGLGALAGGIRKVEGYRFIGSAKSGVIIGGTLGFLLPGITSGLAITGCLSALAGIGGTFVSKGNAVVGKISSGILGLLSLIKFFG